MLSRMGWLYSTKVQWCTLINEKEKSNGASVVRVGKRRVDVTCFALGRNHDDVGVTLLVWVEDRTLIQKKKINYQGLILAGMCFFSIWCCVCARARWRPAQPNQLQAHNTRPMMLPVHADLPAESQKPPVEFLPKQLFATPSFFFASIKPSVLLLISVPGPTFDLTGPRRWIKPRRTSVPSSTDVRRLLLLVRRFGSFCCLCIFPSSGWDGIYSMLMWWSLPCCKLQFRFEMETGMEQIGSRLQALKRLYVRAASASQGSGTAHEKCNIRIVNFTASLLF